MLAGKLFSLFTYIYFAHQCYGDWVSEWMSPIQELYNYKHSPRRVNGDIYFDANEPTKMVQGPIPSDFIEKVPKAALIASRDMRTMDESTESLKHRLENTLETAEKMVKELKLQIQARISKETQIKQAIVSGSSGVTKVTVATMAGEPRSYIIRDNIWYLCHGTLRSPAEVKCDGQEEQMQNEDPCAFNSIKKYETVPLKRMSEYYEDHYLCLKSSFNNTIERFLSVPRDIVHTTCTNGVIRNMDENIKQCGLRMMSEYTFYPNRNISLGLPLEYCLEGDGSCKLIVAWHVSNSSIQNFEFLKNEENFKKFFLKPGPIKHII